MPPTNLMSRRSTLGVSKPQALDQAAPRMVHPPILLATNQHTRFAEHLLLCSLVPYTTPWDDETAPRDPDAVPIPSLVAPRLGVLNHGMRQRPAPPRWDNGPQSPISVLRQWHGSMPRTLSRPTDALHLSKFQVFLRLHIEAFAADWNDCTTQQRGRTKRIALGQVGIRCRHCAAHSHQPRSKGSVYFPASTLGIYQAAQNMSSTHLQCGLCPCMPESCQTLFTELLSTKTAGNHSLAGRRYWQAGALALGLVDTDHGIAFK